MNEDIIEETPHGLCRLEYALILAAIIAVYVLFVLIRDASGPTVYNSVQIIIAIIACLMFRWRLINAGINPIWTLILLLPFWPITMIGAAFFKSKKPAPIA